MTVVDGRFEEQTENEILDAMIADAKEYWGNDIDDDMLSVVRIFYEPIAARLAEAQSDIGLVLDNTQIDHASGQALDFLTALIGVPRESATKATGQVTFSRSTAAGQDYTISSGTEVQTDENDPIKFQTTETVTLSSGSTSVTANIEAVNAGNEGNVGANTITVFVNKPTGVESVTNSAGTSGGSDEETDDELRNRAKDELGTGSRASAPALINSLSKLDGVESVSIFINDTSTDNTGTGGLPDHSFELSVLGGNDQEIADKIVEIKAAGDHSYSGAHGSTVSQSVDLPNGQSHTIEFSRPTQQTLYADIDLTKTDEYAGDDAVRDSIVEYVGGTLSSGNDITGELLNGDDVIYGEIEYAIRDVDGVFDITNLEIAFSSSPTGTSNLTVADGEVANADATGTNLDVASSNV